MMKHTAQPVLDETDWKLIEALQRDARQSYTALGQQVGLSRPAVVERIRRLEDSGVITGYRAVIDPSKLGLDITAFVRISTQTVEESQELSRLIRESPEVQECYCGTGSDCFTMRVLVASLEQLDAFLERIRVYGNPISSVMLSSVVTQRDFRLSDMWHS
jgi:Transcriptional regulators